MKLFCGSRRGSLLFVIAMEPLAIAIRTNLSISGIRMGDLEHRIALYADDAMLFLTGLEKSIPSLSNLLLFLVLR